MLVFWNASVVASRNLCLSNGGGADKQESNGIVLETLLLWLCVGSL